MNKKIILLGFLVLILVPIVNAEVTYIDNGWFLEKKEEIGEYINVSINKNLDDSWTFYVEPQKELIKESKSLIPNLPKLSKAGLSNLNRINNYPITIYKKKCCSLEELTERSCDYWTDGEPCIWVNVTDEFISKGKLDKTRIDLTSVKNTDKQINLKIDKFLNGEGMYRIKLGFNSVSYDSGTNTLTIKGNATFCNSTDPCTLHDIDQYDTAGCIDEYCDNAGVCTYHIKCRLYFGEALASYITNFITQRESIWCRNETYTGQASNCFYFHHNSTMTSGAIGNAALHKVKWGSQFFFSRHPTWYYYGIASASNNGDNKALFYIYDSQFKMSLNGTIVGGTLNQFRDGRVWQSDFKDGAEFTTWASGMDAYGVKQTYGSWFIRNPEEGVTIENVESCMDNEPIYFRTYGATIDGFKDYCATPRLARVYEVTSGDMILIDVDVPGGWGIRWENISGSETTSDLLIKYRFNINLNEVDGSPVEGATVTLEDNEGNIQISDTTNSTGQLSSGTAFVIMANLTFPEPCDSTNSECDGGGDSDTCYDYVHSNDASDTWIEWYILTIEKAGYVPITLNLSIDEPKELDLEMHGKRDLHPLNLMMVSDTEYKVGETIDVAVQITDAYGDPITDANCWFDIYYPNKTLWKDNINATHLSHGIYYNNTYTAPTTYGAYIYVANCTYNSITSYKSKTFHVANWTSDISDIKTLSEEINTTTHNILTNQSTIVSLINSLANITAQDVWSYTNRILSNYSGIWSYSTRTLSDYNQTNMWVYLEDINATVTDINGYHTSEYTILVSDVNEVAQGEEYWLKVWITNRAGEHIDADSTPKVSLYDPVRNEIVSDASLTKVEDGIYIYNYTTTSGLTGGTWEAIVNTTVNGINNKFSDWWELESSPAEVSILSIKSKVLPSITAEVRIVNEGNSGYEYSYEYCIVNSQSNACGGGDDLAYSSGAKYLSSGETWETDLTLDGIDDSGLLWFKIIVYYGTETSGASRSFYPDVETGGPLRTLESEEEIGEKIVVVAGQIPILSYIIDFLGEYGINAIYVFLILFSVFTIVAIYLMLKKYGIFWTLIAIGIILGADFLISKLLTMFL